MIGGYCYIISYNILPNHIAIVILKPTRQEDPYQQNIMEAHHGSYEFI